MIIPANPGFDALYLTHDHTPKPGRIMTGDEFIRAFTPSGFIATPIIAWYIEHFPETEDFHVTAIDVDNGPPRYDAVRYPDGHVFAADSYFDSVRDWLNDVCLTRAR